MTTTDRNHLLDAAQLAAAQLNAAGVVHQNPAWVETATALRMAVLREVCGNNPPLGASGETVEEHCERVLQTVGTEL